MKGRRIHLAAVVIVTGLAAGALTSAARTSRGQSPKPRNESPVKPTSMVRPANPASANAAPALVAATEKNAVFKNELNWTFGGKQQRGWYLYTLLIAQTLNNQNEAATTDFAAALGVWQKQMGLSSEGVLDEDSWMAMVAQWQNNRIQDRALAEPDQLLTAPSSDFFDPDRLGRVETGRAQHLRGLQTNDSPLRSLTRRLSSRILRPASSRQT
jgi:hypothetical protein